LENWTKALDEGYGLDVVYLDYRTSFDNVPHRRLTEKLKSFGNWYQWETATVVGQLPYI